MDVWQEEIPNKILIKDLSNQKIYSANHHHWVKEIVFIQL